MAAAPAAGDGSTGTALGGRIGGRATYGVTNAVALEVGLGAWLGPHLRFDDAPLPPPNSTRGIEERTDIGLRTTVGATLRLGVKFIPTVTLFAGYQHRILGDRLYTDASGTIVEADPPSSVNELLVGVGLGLDYRLSATWVLGISVQFIHGTSGFNSFEVPFAAGGYWYVRSTPDFLPGSRPLQVSAR